MSTKKSRKKGQLQLFIDLLKKKNKRVLLALSFFGFILLGSTYAWFTSADSITNSFQGTQLAAEIDEVFEPPKAWEPNQQVTKDVRVKNTGKAPALVRVSLYEFFLSFQVDVAGGTGNLKTVPNPVQPAVDEQDTSTWQAATAGGTFTRESKHYPAKTAIIPDPLTGSGKYMYGSSTRPNTALASITLNFSTAFRPTPPATGSTKYWLYEDGYFYYSEVLQPGEASEPLLNSLRLAAAVPNQYKGALYKLKIYMDAHDTTATVSNEWQVTPGGAVAKMLEGKVTP